MLAYEPSPAISEERGSMIRQAQSSSVYLDRSGVLEELWEALGECNEEDWDGNGAAPASIEAYFTARDVLRALPEGIPDPDVGFSPQGRALLEWYLAPRQVLTLSIAETGEIASSLMLGRSKRTGTVLFIDEIPETVLADLRRLYSGSR